MRRREFITMLGSASMAWPLTAHAQQAGKLRIIGFLGTASASTWAPWSAAFVRRLQELGWEEGRSVAIEFRWAEGRSERIAEIAAEFVRLKVDVIFTSGGGVAAAKQATSTIPIVFALARDPVGSGFVDSLARPGGNVTGISGQSTEAIGKRIELLHEVIPGLRRMAVIATVTNSALVAELNDIQAMARRRGLEVVTPDIRRSEDIAPAIEALKGRVNALYVLADPLLITNRTRISTFALATHLPTIYAQREFVDAAGLMSYGANIPIQFRRAADFVDKILRGAKPADIPVEQPVKFDLIINLTTAKALGLTIPPTLVATADEVIE